MQSIANHLPLLLLAGGTSKRLSHAMLAPKYREDRAMGDKTAFYLKLLAYGGAVVAAVIAGVAIYSGDLQGAVKLLGASVAFLAGV